MADDDLVCGRCYEKVKQLFEPNCNEKPEALAGQHIGQYHCSDCGAMVVAGLPHPDVCALCRDFEHPWFDGEPIKIENETDYQKALIKIKELIDIDPEPSSADGIRLKIISNIIEAYEEKHYPELFKK